MGIMGALRTEQNGSTVNNKDRPCKANISSSLPVFIDIVIPDSHSNPLTMLEEGAGAYTVSNMWGPDFVKMFCPPPPPPLPLK